MQCMPYAMINQEKLQSVLQNQFGFDHFRSGQQEAIMTLLTQYRLLCIQPTGHGKSLLYQLPAVLLEGMTVVISPLLALMRDQLRQLNTRFHIKAGAINSDQTEEENAQTQQQAKEGRIKILFVSPEQLDNVFQFEFLLALTVSLIVIDEAHCISTWGHDFRPSYRQILRFIHEIEKKSADIKILGLTATANDRTQADIMVQLETQAKRIHVRRESMDRPNIQLTAITANGIAEKLHIIESLLEQWPGDGLIYCATRENTELVADYLQLKKINAAAYHAGFESEQKRKLQQAFTANQYKVIAATNALGMGIDKSDLRFIIHFDIPGSITAYYQEVGRCGRDGLTAHGILLFDPQDKKIQEYFIDSAQPTGTDFQKVLSVVRQAKTLPKLSDLKRLTGLHPTRVTVIIAELVEQGFLQKIKQGCAQVYRATHKMGEPNLSRYFNQFEVKTHELMAMMDYAAQTTNCRMAILRNALGDHEAASCSHCDICHPDLQKIQIDQNKIQDIQQWLAENPVLIKPILRYNIAAGVAVMDSKLRTETFLQFMRQRQQTAAMDSKLQALIDKNLTLLKRTHKIGCVIPVPSRTWCLRNQFAQWIADQLNVPVLIDYLYWQTLPAARQGELLNNDQRQHNVKNKMFEQSQRSIPVGAILLLDDYVGSGATFKEAARVLRRRLSKKQTIIPFALASVKWRLGRRGMV